MPFLTALQILHHHLIDVPACKIDHLLQNYCWDSQFRFNLDLTTFLALNFIPCWMCSRVVVPQPDALQIAERKVCGQQKHVSPTPLKDRLIGVCEVVGLTFSFRAQQSYRHLQPSTEMLRIWQHPKCHLISVLLFLHVSVAVTDLRGSGGAMAMACTEIQQITILSQGIIILKHCYLDLVCGKTRCSWIHL